MQVIFIIQEPGVSSAILKYQFTQDDLKEMNWQDQPIFDDSDLDAWSTVVQFYR
jgi:hypothetical protein